RRGGKGGSATPGRRHAATASPAAGRLSRAAAAARCRLTRGRGTGGASGRLRALDRLEDPLVVMSAAVVETNRRVLALADDADDPALGTAADDSAWTRGP